MQTAGPAKYGFHIRTRSGAVVDNLLIFGHDAAEAERKLRQIYIGCEILSVRRQAVQAPRTASYADVVDLISG